MKCILCYSDNVANIEQIRAESLIALYKKAFHIAVDNILHQDIIYWHCKECDLRFFSLKNGEIPCGDNAFYNAINGLEWYYMSEKHEYHFVKNYIKDTSKVLEVGCGRAAFAEFIPDKRNYTGLELSTNAKEMAAKNNVNIINSFVENFARESKESFDIACSFQVLEHTSTPYSFIESQIKCLKNGLESTNNKSANNNGGGGESLRF